MKPAPRLQAQSPITFDVLSHDSRSNGAGKPNDHCHRLDRLLRLLEKQV